MDESRDETWFALYPRLIREACGDFDNRSTDEWPSREFVDLHVVLIALVRRLHQRVPIRLAEISDEAYALGAWSAGDTGIAIGLKIAEAGSLSIVKSTDVYAILPFDTD